MTKTERITEALEYRMEEMSGEQSNVRTQISNLTGSLLKLNYDLTEKMNELSTVKSCMRKIEKGGMNKHELAESRKLFNNQQELIEVSIEAIKSYIAAMSNKIEELKMVHEDLSADIEAITEFVLEAKKEPIQPLVAVNESA